MQQHCLYTDTYICYNDNAYDDDDDKYDDMIITIIITKTMTMTTKTMMMMITSIPVVCFHSCCITTRLSAELQAQVYYTFIIK